ncbi:MAG: hypothetical protein IBV52_08940 [Candidatus Bathyarchaeota archaeon]
MVFEVIEESDLIRATDRLVDRIRQVQQLKIFTAEMIILVVIVGILCNLIADVTVGLLINQVPSNSFSTYVMLLMLSLLGVGSFCIVIYRVARRYSGGGMDTYFFYGYKVQSKIHNTAESLVEEIWKMIDPLATWQIPRRSSIATTLKEELTFLYFSSKPLEKSKMEKEDRYDIYILGEFMYLVFRRLWDEFTSSKERIMPSRDKMTELVSCKVSILLRGWKIVENTFRINFSVGLKIKRPTSPKADELVQDIAVHLRSLERDLRKSLKEIS